MNPLPAYIDNSVQSIFAADNSTELRFTREKRNEV